MGNVSKLPTNYDQRLTAVLLAARKAHANEAGYLDQLKARVDLDHDGNPDELRSGLFCRCWGSPQRLTITDANNKVTDNEQTSNPVAQFTYQKGKLVDSYSNYTFKNSVLNEEQLEQLEKALGIPSSKK